LISPPLDGDDGHNNNNSKVLSPSIIWGNYSKKSITLERYFPKTKGFLAHFSLVHVSFFVLCNLGFQVFKSLTYTGILQPHTYMCNKIQDTKTIPQSRSPYVSNMRYHYYLKTFNKSQTTIIHPLRVNYIHRGQGQKRYN
jgi:hypothetical protein